MKDRSLIKFLLSFALLAGTLLSCKDKDELSIPILNPGVVFAVSDTSAVYIFNLRSDGGGEILSKGVCWSATGLPLETGYARLVMSEKNLDTVRISGLTAGTAYYIRSFAINQYGTSYSKTDSFTTLIPALASIQTDTVFEPTDSSVIVKGHFIDKGPLPVYRAGVCWTSFNNTLPTINDNGVEVPVNSDSFDVNVKGLGSNQLYAFRTFVVNKKGVSYGRVVYAKTNLESGVVSDVDGNIYKYIQIGNLVWMVENLKTTHYSDGTLIPECRDSVSWISLQNGAYCDYKNDNLNGAVYGHLYNWYTVNSTHKLAPAGWRVATLEDWTNLVSYVGGFQVAGSRLKSSNSNFWQSGNLVNDNIYGFEAQGGGHRSLEGAFGGMNRYGIWWTSTPYYDNMSYRWSMDYNKISIERNANANTLGFSVRCVRDARR